MQGTRVFYFMQIIFYFDFIKDWWPIAAQVPWILFFSFHVKGYPKSRRRRMIIIIIDNMAHSMWLFIFVIIFFFYFISPRNNTCVIFLYTSRSMSCPTIYFRVIFITLRTLLYYVCVVINNFNVDPDAIFLRYDYNWRLTYRHAHTVLPQCFFFSFYFVEKAYKFIIR